MPEYERAAPLRVQRRPAARIHGVARTYPAGAEVEATVKKVPILIVYVAMVLFLIVSMWTTYKSVMDSILPGPTIPIPLPNGGTYNCSIFALLLSVAIGLMLLALKMAIIDEQKRLNVLGVVGLTIVAFISIMFNMDVFYRIADQDFFLRYSDGHMRSVYENYLTEVQAKLTDRRQELMKQVAKQEGELESEIRGLRKKVAGYGSEARKESYALTLLQKQTEVDLNALDEARTAKTEADKLLATPSAKSLDEIDQLQAQLRVALTSLGAVANVRLPDSVTSKSPLWAVFDKFTHIRDIGAREIFVLILAFLLDLGDIIGYSLIPNKPAKNMPGPLWSSAPETLQASGPPNITGPELVEPKELRLQPARTPESAESRLSAPFEVTEPDASTLHAVRRRRPLRRR
jgi:hypothetical protein